MSTYIQQLNASIAILPDDDLPRFQRFMFTF